MSNCQSKVIHSASRKKQFVLSNDYIETSRIAMSWIVAERNTSICNYFNVICRVQRIFPINSCRSWTERKFIVNAKRNVLSWQILILCKIQCSMHKLQFTALRNRGIFVICCDYCMMHTAIKNECATRINHRDELGCIIVVITWIAQLLVIMSTHFGCVQYARDVFVQFLCK